jgi:hypothetical protein
MKIVKEKESCLSGHETYGPVLIDRGDTMQRNRFFLAFSNQHFTFGRLMPFPFESPARG